MSRWTLRRTRRAPDRPRVVPLRWIGLVALALLAAIDVGCLSLPPVGLGTPGGSGGARQDAGVQHDAPTDRNETTGGSAQGGKATGGTPLGGMGTAGAATGGGGHAGSGGGAGSGGSPTGGMGLGGAATGGMATGGTAAAGGVATGGVMATGGKATGGVATGGMATGGVATGGMATGGMATGGMATGGMATGGTPPRPSGPCDIYAAASTPCVAAYSTIRALSKDYKGALYQVRNGSSAANTGTGGVLKDIVVMSDGFPDTSSQDTFCAGTTCTFSLLYDQSGNGNDLKVAPKGVPGNGFSDMDNFESTATNGSLMVNGHHVYPLYMAVREGYRLTARGKGMPLGSEAQGIYMLADGTHSGMACCWDFGNVSTDPMKYGVSNTLFFGTGYWGHGAPPGPWFMVDFEGGVWAGGSVAGDPGWGGGGTNPANTNNPSLKVHYAFGISKTNATNYTIRAADLSTATDLTTAYDGLPPTTFNNLGGIVLGVGADNSNNSFGTFYEGAITSGRPTNDTDLAVMRNVAAAHYGM